MSAPQSPVAFGDCVVDLARRELRRDGAPVAVEPQVFDLIAHLAAHPGEIVTRDDLIEHVWGGRIVSDSAIASRINAARAALGDDGTAQRYIKTVPRRGFRFEADLQAPSDAAPQLPDKPSIAILPFRNMSGDPEQTYFSDGITDDIITALSRYQELFVIARHSSFAYRDSAMPLSAIARELGVQYIAEGSVRRAGNRIRVTAGLTDPWAGRQLWSERYDRDLADIFELQDEITGYVVNALAGQITIQHQRRAMEKSPDAIEAYDHVLRALELVWKMGPEDCRRAREEAERALAINPGLARAHAVIGWTYLTDAVSNWWGDAGELIDRALKAARAGVAADDREPWAHAVLGWVYAWRDRDAVRGMRELAIARDLTPGSVYYRSLHAFMATYSGRSAEALAELETAMRLNPHHPLAYHIFVGRALLNLDRADEALPHFERIRHAMALNTNAVAHCAACYAALGMMDEAAATVREIQASNPRFTLGHVRRIVPYTIPEERDRFLALLERAGLPE